MGKIKRYKNAVERFLSGENGQRFFNFAYSIGAAVVIWGGLFKILHLPGGNTLLCIGMGTEVLMFILTAFDPPPRDYHWEEVFPVLSSHNPEDRPAQVGAEADGPTADGNVNGNVNIVGGGTIVLGASGMQGTATAAQSIAQPVAQPLTPPTASGLTMTPLSEITDIDGAQNAYAERMTEIAAQMDRLRQTTESLNSASEVLLQSYRAITDNSDGISSSSTGYVEQMAALNRNIQGLNTIYEIQLKSVSSQLDAIDRVNRGIKDIRDMYEKSSAQSARYYEETEKMARYMQQLNQVYEKMIHAMTLNMPMAPVTPAAPVVDPAAIHPAEPPRPHHTDNIG